MTRTLLLSFQTSAVRTALDGSIGELDRAVAEEAAKRPEVRLLMTHRLEVPLHAVHSDRKDVHEAQVLGVLREHWREHA